MNCTDCKEEMTSAEEKHGVHCALCHGALHPECAMVDHRENDVCERCYNVSNAKYMNWAKGRGVEA